MTPQEALRSNRGLKLTVGAVDSWGGTSRAARSLNPALDATYQISCLFELFVKEQLVDATTSKCPDSKQPDPSREKDTWNSCRQQDQSTHRYCQKQKD